MELEDIRQAVNDLYWDVEQHHYNLDDDTLKVIDTIINHLRKKN